MANFLVIVDPNASRRRAFVREMEPTLALVQGLRVARLETGDLSAVWAASERAPVSTHAEADAAAIVWGHALAAAERVTADRVAREWTESAAPSPYDGYFAAAAFLMFSGTGMTT